MKIRIHRNGINYGPYSESSVRSFLEEGTLSPTDLAWTPGRTEWTKLESLLGETEDGAGVSALSDEDKENIDKIKNLVEKEQAEHALDLVLGLDSAEVVCTLLKDCSIKTCRFTGGKEPLHMPDWMNNASTFFLGLLNALPPDCEGRVPSSILPRNITHLFINPDMSKSLKDLDLMEKLSNLQTLELIQCQDLVSIEGLSKLTMLEEVRIESCSSLTSAKAVLKLPQLTSLILRDCPIPQGEVDEIEKLLNFSNLRKLVFPDGSEMEKLGPEEVDAGKFPSFALVLGGHGFAANVGSLTKRQYEYWDNEENGRLSLEDALLDSNFEVQKEAGVPEDAQLAYYDELDDLFYKEGTDGGYLEITELKSDEDGWIRKKTNSYNLSIGSCACPGVSFEEDTESFWDEMTPEGPYVIVGNEAKGSFLEAKVEGKEFDPTQLVFLTHSLWGGPMIWQIRYEGEIVFHEPGSWNGKAFSYEIYSGENKRDSS